MMAIVAALLVCSMPMPLAEGEAPEDRRIAMARVPLPAEMIESMQGPAPVSNFPFVEGERGQKEWVIASPRADENGAHQIIRLTRREDFLSPYVARLGNGVQDENGQFDFTLTGEGVCRFDSSTQSEPAQ
jgi:hypothetical protein